MVAPVEVGEGGVALLFSAGAAWANRDEGMAAFECLRFAGARCISVTDNWRDCYVINA
jgi:hypothetical protein